MAWQGAGQIEHRLLGLDRLAGIATVAGPYVYASLSSGWASALAADRVERYRQDLRSRPCPCSQSRED
jgi:hypothetical protein